MRGLSGRQQLGPRHNCFGFLRVRGGGFVLVLGQGVFFLFVWALGKMEQNLRKVCGYSYVL